jgi:hypothetical protein
MAKHKKWKIAKWLGGTAAALSICYTCYGFYRTATTAPTAVVPTASKLTFSHSNQGTFLSWEQIPGSPPILPDTLQPHEYSFVQPEPKVAAAKPAPWQYLAKVYDQGDPENEGLSHIEHRSCPKDRPLVCYSPRWLRNRIVIEAF